MLERDKYIIHIADLIVAELKGTIDQQGLNELQAWKCENPEHLRLYHLYRSEDFLVQKFNFIRAYNALDAYTEFEKRVQKAEQRKQRIVLFCRVAVVLLFAISGGVFYWFQTVSYDVVETKENVSLKACKAILTEPDGTKVDISDTTYLAFVQKQLTSISDSVSKDESRGSYHVITIPRGGAYDLQLKDGSRLRMNSESEIRIPLTFGKSQREVFMKGEIYFDVVRDMEHPFVVHACQGTVRVLGTSFNVRNYQDEDFLEATLVNGEVVFEQGGKSDFLKPGEQLRLNKASGIATIDSVDIFLYCAWKDGRFVFEKQSLEKIMNTIARCYDVDVVYENEFLKDILFTGNIQRYDDLKRVIKVLQLMNKIDISLEGKTVFVRNDN